MHVLFCQRRTPARPGSTITNVRLMTSITTCTVEYLADGGTSGHVALTALEVLRAESRTDPARMAAVGYGTGAPSGWNSGATASTCASSGQ